MANDAARTVVATLARPNTPKLNRMISCPVAARSSGLPGREITL